MLKYGMMTAFAAAGSMGLFGLATIPQGTEGLAGTTSSVPAPDPFSTPSVTEIAPPGPSTPPAPPVRERIRERRGEGGPETADAPPARERVRARERGETLPPDSTGPEGAWRRIAPPPGGPAGPAGPGVGGTPRGPIAGPRGPQPPVGGRLGGPNAPGGGAGGGPMRAPGHGRDMEVTNRIRHLMEAGQSLQAAGMPERAQELFEEARRLQAQLAERRAAGRSDDGARGGGDELQELRQHVRRLHAEIVELRAIVEELRAELEGRQRRQPAPPRGGGIGGGGGGGAGAGAGGGGGGVMNGPRPPRGGGGGGAGGGPR